MEKYAALQVTAAMLVCRLLGLDLNQLKLKTSGLSNYESSGNMYLLKSESRIKNCFYIHPVIEVVFPHLLH